MRHKYHSTPHELDVCVCVCVCGVWGGGARYSHININVHDNWYSMSGCVLLSTVFIPFVRS